MNRIAGIVLAAIGLIVIVVGALKLVPGVVGSGVFIFLVGGLLFGLSFIPMPDPEDATKMSAGATLLNIFVSPAETFQNLRRHPQWITAAIIIVLFSGLFANLFIYRLTAERIVNFTIEKTLQLPIMNDEARRQVEAGRQDAIDQAKNPVAKGIQIVSTFAGNTLKYSVYAVIFLLFVLAMGGRINFWQGVSVAAYAALPPALIAAILGSLILFLKDPVDIHPVLGQGDLVQDNLGFLFKPSENPALYALSSHFSLLWFYWVWLTATGLKNAGERVSGSIAWTIAIVLFLILLVVGVVISFFFSGFMS